MSISCKMLFLSLSDSSLPLVFPRPLELQTLWASVRKNNTLAHMLRRSARQARLNFTVQVRHSQNSANAFHSLHTSSGLFCWSSRPIHLKFHQKKSNVFSQAAWTETLLDLCKGRSNTVGGNRGRGPSADWLGGWAAASLCDKTRGLDVKS